MKNVDRNIYDVRYLYIKWSSISNEYGLLGSLGFGGICLMIISGRHQNGVIFVFIYSTGVNYMKH